MTEDKILIVDDEERIRKLIKEYLAPQDYKIYEASNGIEAIDCCRKNDFSLILLDVMMPLMDGWSVCREIRKSSSVPIIMLTARNEEYDKLYGFELGIDDYVSKPFSPHELLARIKAIMRRSKARHIEEFGEKAVFEGLVVEYDSRNVYVDGERIQLTRKEYDLLAFFARNRNRVFSRSKLLDEVWGYDFTGDDRTVNTHIKMLRENLKHYRKFIVTVWGTGYKFEAGTKA